MNKNDQKNKAENFVESQKRIIEHLEHALEGLEELGETCEDCRLWFLIPGTSGYRINRLVQSLRDIIVEVHLMMPEIESQKES